MAFFGSRVPQEVKLFIKALNRVDRSAYKKIFQVSLATFEGKEIPAESCQKLCEGASEAEKECFVVMAAGLLTLFRLIYRVSESSIKPEILRADLGEIRLPTDVIDDLIEVAYGQNRKRVSQAINLHRPALPNLQKLRWRVDVSISTSTLSRVLEPTIMMEMVLSNNTVKHFEVPMKVFHKLRCNVASVLKEMEDLENRQVLKMLESGH